MLSRIYIGCCATDLWQARISVASIRYWYPEVAICLLCDYGRGRFETREIEEHWQVEVMVSEARFSGWGVPKLSLLFRPGAEKFLYLDADTAFVGPALDPLQARPEQFIISPDLIDDPLRNPVMGVYFDVARLRALDPDYEFPGHVFNSGQFVATAGLLTPDDFTFAYEWSQPPVARHPGLFFTMDQGCLNYVLHRKARLGEITLGTATLYYDGRSDEAAALRFDPPAPDHAFLLHWPGEKKPLARAMTRGDILGFFEDLYYERVPGGWWRRRARAAQRCFAMARRWAFVTAYACGPRQLVAWARRTRGQDS